MVKRNGFPIRVLQGNKTNRMCVYVCAHTHTHTHTLYRYVKRCVMRKWLM